LHQAICTYQSVNIRQISQGRAEQVGYYRFLENEAVTVSELVRGLAEHCEQQVTGQHVLALSDSSEINLQAHAGRLKPEEIGLVGNHEEIGFYIHPTLVLNATSGFPLGISSLQLWSRPPERPDKRSRAYKQLPIEQKESYKWVKAAQESQPFLHSGGAQVTYVGDREADIYEEWSTVATAQTHLLIRASQDRCLLGESQMLFAILSQQPCEGTYRVWLAGDERRGRKAREAWVAVRCCPVHLQRPARLERSEYPPSVALYAVEAREVHPPTGQEPLHWRLLTTHSVVCVEQALQVIEWYRWRWRIEQLFATLKQPGFNLEATQLESGLAIQRLCVLALSAALRVLQLVEGRDDPTQSAQLVLSPEQQQCLEQIAPTLAGRTLKQQNPHPSQTLAWVAWLIARLGGWAGYQSQPPPGIATMLRGLQQFESIFTGWKLAQDVCTP